MDWLSSSRGSRKELEMASFIVEEESFSMPMEVLNRKDIANSGLGLIYRDEGFKELPRRLARTTQGEIVIPRGSAKTFRLLVQYISGGVPLLGVSLSSLAEAYISLKNELDYWAIPSDTLKLPNTAWTRSCWTDFSCFYAIPFGETDHCTLEVEQEKLGARKARLAKLDSIPEDLKIFLEDNQSWKIYGALAGENNSVIIAAGEDRLVCKVPQWPNPCVYYGSFPPDEAFSPIVVAPNFTEYLIVWTKGTFISIKILRKEENVNVECQVFSREKSWLCINPLNGVIYSGNENAWLSCVPGPIPLVTCIDMPNTAVIKFFPWGVLAIASEVTLSNKKKIESEPTAKDDAGMLRYGDLTSVLGTPSGQHEDNEDAEFIAKAITRPTADSNVGGYAITYFSLVNMSSNPGSVVKLKYNIDYDMIDTPDGNEQREPLILLRGSLACFKKSLRGGITNSVLMIDEDGIQLSQPGVLIKSGGPLKEHLVNPNLYGEYIVSEESYKVYAMGKKLYDYHVQQYLSNKATSDKSEGCNIQ